ncbi:hypothetical protein GDO81_016182 [Engystomops pustulosus]|uniref:Citrate synthase-lysine N-methyltransferase CSKMT, mitochondrial n=2 Tax=Engystomops pustulosus TaxID=76066 RepID=A0AAV7AW25_ENGPU|nr:hypothetical protein GDO81_016182 [Engystomops pustulosus]KAG8563716.1 hypothetical protein GDO81_016182 [Engystomops pustulosus]
MFRLPHRLLPTLRLSLGQRFGTKGDRSHGEGLRHSMGSSSLWDKIYSSRRSKDSSHFDWFCSYKDLEDLLLPLIHEMVPLMKQAEKPLHVLDLGCGTSDIGLGLFRESHLPLWISCIDRSKPAILAMRERVIQDAVTPKHPDSHLEYIEGDVTDLQGVRSGSISLVLDKGTSDSLLRSGTEQAQRLVHEALRVLQMGGKLVQLTDEDPDARLHFLERAGAGPSVTFHDIAQKDGIMYYAYIVTQKKHLKGER